MQQISAPQMKYAQVAWDSKFSLKVIKYRAMPEEEGFTGKKCDDDEGGAR